MVQNEKGRQAPIKKFASLVLLCHQIGDLCKIGSLLLSYLLCSLCTTLQGIKFYHKALQEFFVALKLSTLDEVNLANWLEQNVFNEKYDEVICYLTGILSNKGKQAFVLDYLESHNLKLYIITLKSRRNFSASETTFDYQYVQKYLAKIMKTYETIIQVFFNHIRHVFDGYSINGTGKLYVSGNINFSKKQSRCLYMKESQK